MKISYNWLKWYIPDAQEAQKLADVFTYHLAEVESVDALGEDFIFDVKILPNRAHDLLSHQGMAREIASLLNIKFNDPTELYKIPESKPTSLSIKIESDKCRRYMGRIIRGVKVGPSPEWVVKHLESIGQRSINNMVDAANIVMYDCGQPTHVFDLNKLKGGITVRQALAGETMTTLDNKECAFKDTDLVIADDERVLAVAGVKGGKFAEVDENTTDIVLEVANFDPTSVRKTAGRLNIFTDAKKRFENDLSPELGAYAMREFTATILEMCPDAVFEDIVDLYPNKQKEQKLVFRTEKIKSILGIDLTANDIAEVLKRYNFTYTEEARVFEVTVPPMRLDLNIEEDMAEEIGRILGYDKVKGTLPKIDFKPKSNELYARICFAREKLLSEGYSEIMTTSFSNKGEVGVLASASDKNFLRTNLTDGFKESMKLNLSNMALLGLAEVKLFEIGTVFLKDMEEMRVVYGNKKEIKEVTLIEFCGGLDTQMFSSGPRLGHEYVSPDREENISVSSDHAESASGLFHAWSPFPFIARDVAVWVPEGVESGDVQTLIKENAGNLVVRGPELFDEFKKDGKVSYAFRLVFQSYDRTLTDEEVNTVMQNINTKITEKEGWQVR